MLVSLEREDELVGQVVAPFFPQVRNGEREKMRGAGGREKGRNRRENNAYFNFYWSLNMHSQWFD